MDFFEIELLFENSYMFKRDFWEMTRILAYYNTQIHSKKKIDFSKFIPLPGKKKKDIDEKLSEFDVKKLEEEFKKHLK